MYADAALSGSAFDPERQTHAAVLGSALANFVHARRPGNIRQSPGRAGQALALGQLADGDRGGSDEDVAGASYRSYRRSRDYLEEHYLVLRNLAEVAKACRLTQTYLCRLFHRYEGCSPYKRLLRLKMDHAAALLQNPSVSVKCAGLEVGFDDPYHFSKTFKQVLGVPPTSLRAR
jgi:AraC-like DNA-binding protein